MENSEHTSLRSLARILQTGIIALLFFSPSYVHAANRPNFLIVMADDCTFNDLPVYGGKNARTPNIDAFAKQSLIFKRAYLSEAMCQPCRAELFSGQFPLRNGCAWNHSASRSSTKSMPQLLKPAGYRVGLAGKKHVKPNDAFPFEDVGGFDSNCVRDPTKPSDLQPLRQFLARDQTQPFCLVVALVEPHVPWVMGDASQYPPAKIQLPPNIADTPRTREDFGRYLAEITYMDNQFGQILQTLEESGAADDTLVIFTSEQGSQFPGNKWTNWDTGLHTALIARWPGHVQPGQTDAIVQYCDVVPTFLGLAGAKSKVHFDGSSFATVLTGSVQQHRRYAFGLHNNVPEGPPYPIRTISNGEFRYIRNLSPAELYIEKHLMGGGRLNNPYWTTWVGTAWNTPRTYDLVKRYSRRPAEQLYHTADDPYEMKDLANDPQYADIKNELSSRLDKWLKEQGDPGVAEDTNKAHKAAKQGHHLYAPPK